MPKVGKWQEIPAYQCCNFLPTPVTCTTLGDAAHFVVLGASTVTNTGSSIVNGDLGLSPGTSVIGFPPGIVNGTKFITDGVAAAGKVSAQTAFDCLGALTPTSTLSADIGGTTVIPGVYTFGSSAAITGTLTLNGGGNPNALFVFIVPSTLVTASSSNVSLTNGTKAGNVYWIVGSSATLGTFSNMVGNIIAQASVTMTTSAKLVGRVFALTAAVTLDGNNITGATCTVNPCPTTTSTSTTSSSTSSTSTSTSTSSTTTTTTTNLG